MRSVALGLAVLVSVSVGQAQAEVSFQGLDQMSPPLG